MALRLFYVCRSNPFSRTIIRALSTSSVIRSRSEINNESSDFLEDFLQRHRPEKRAIDHFSSQDWTCKIIQDESYEIVPFFSRQWNEHTNENRFFSTVVSTEKTIPHVLALRHKGFTSFGHSQGEKQQPETPFAGDDSTFEVQCLMSVGTDLDSHPAVVNGGFQCAMFDEVSWFLILMHQNATAQPGPRDLHFTLNITTNFYAPVVTPSDVLVRARLVKREGRKWWARAEMVNSIGQILTTADSLWLTARKS